MITPELVKKIDLLPAESYHRVESFVDQIIDLNMQDRREDAFRIFMNKMDKSEKSVLENGFYSEEEVEKELEKI
ncbi:MAG: hypothetical protein HFH49_10320 [Lachnospiraceae bacterium]|nr:hypothetical protein [Lachnospiraceae bacterium]